MVVVRQDEVTPAEIALRRELEIRFSRVLAEMLRQPRCSGVPAARMGSACAVAVLNAIHSVCRFEITDEVLQDFFEEAFAIWVQFMTAENALPVLEPKLGSEDPEFLEPEILGPADAPEPEPFAHLLLQDDTKTKETEESEISRILLSIGRKDGEETK